MNPAALRTNLPDLERGGILIVNTGAFKAKNLELAGYEKNPLEDGSLAGYRVVQIDFGKHVIAALTGSGMSTRDIARTQNFFALGLLFWMYGRDPIRELASIRQKFAKSPELASSEHQGLRGGLPPRRDHGAVRRDLRGAGRAACARATTATSPATRRPRSGSSRRAKLADLPLVLRELPDHARVRRPAQPGGASRATA